jgi:hypothetical protein
MSSNHLALPIAFRVDDINHVLQSLLAGKSCAFIGVGGVGKTRLLRYLSSPVAHQFHFNAHQQHLLLLPLDALAFPHHSALAYYRQMCLSLNTPSQQLQITLPGSDPLFMTNQEIARQALFDRVDALLAADEQQTLVFLFDAFDIPLLEIEPSFFRVLLALRNRACGRVCYVAISSNVPTLICSERGRKVVLETFAELFDGNVRGFKPAEQDAQALLDRDMLRADYPLLPRLQRLLLEITGAHAGMLRASFSALVARYVGRQSLRAVVE